ncbi:MAG: prenyltransferase/squalene oxidase repeat-containing protein [Oscillospiraceae bacterium]
MKGTHIKRLSALLLLLAMLVSLAACGKEETPIEKTARYLQAQIPEPTCAAVGGDWLVFGLARSGLKAPQKYFDTYYKNVEDYIVSVDGVLSRKKNTEYSRVILALTAIGKNPADAAGFNLLLPLGDFDETVRQGVNGVIFALLALDSGGYEIPEAPEAETQATRELYVGELLRREIPDGGWALTGGTPDADMTAMALQALAKYRDRQDVEDAVQRGLAALSALQEPNGAYLSWDEENSESVCQVIVALTELGISLDDERFVKNGQTLPQVLERFACEDGSYRHSLNGNSDEMATEQAFYALAAIHRAETGKTTLYDMTDVMQ